ncbi:polysaccharide biosynthesis tyrosine autokinase [Acinetobacter variabilis]|uniref:Polysaccharide biosynthesis tyrosine autokinase n=1 Tax=Acinetobacter variabilis TaxID=70346 RepID=A0A7T7WIW2_9GAMM|nr:polysaccharide biosynthesis tyrosine autokinase [Acinetobacter variabilis]QQN88058.1 polysaccharide biosynthesis tyrosine autokinase [Acinetobacter variabilis]
MRQTANTEDSIDLKELLFSLIAQWKLITLCIILSMFCVLLYLRVTPYIYNADALIQVEDNKGASAVLSGDLSSTIDHMSPAQAEIEILKSRLVLGNVINHLNLDIEISGTENSFWNRLLKTNKYTTQYSEKSIIFHDNQKSFEIREFSIPTNFLNKNLSLNFEQDRYILTDTSTKLEILSAPLNQISQFQSEHGLWRVGVFSQDRFNSTYNIRKQNLPTAVSNILNHLQISEKGKGAGIISLNYQGTNKEHITQVLNAILVTYGQQNIQRNSAETAQTLKFLEDQLPELKQQLDIAERKFNQFREQYDTVDITQESNLYISQSIGLETTKATLEQQIAETSAKYTSEHPAMKQMNAQLIAINKKIEELNATLKRLPELQRQYLQLFREVEVKQQLYTALLNSYQQLRIVEAGEIGNVRIIDTAVEPLAPISPQKMRAIVIALFIGTFIGLVLALLRNMLRSGIKDAVQIENELDLPVYATVPRSIIQESRIKLLKKKKNIPILAVKDSGEIAIESLRSMRTAIHFALTNATNNVIAIAGPAPEIGKSFITINLATILAQGGKRVLVIDGDMRRGYLHKYFNAEVQPGLAELLNHQNSYEDIVQTSTIDNLYFVTRGKSPVNPSELLSTDQFKTFLDQASAHFDHVLIDTPPALAVTDGIIIAQYAGVNLLIARHAKTQIKELQITVNRFEQANVKVNGVILNDVQKGAADSYGYNYAYAYTANKDND